MATKKFDTIRMKRRGAEAVRKKLAGKSRDEIRKFWAERTERLKREQARRREGRQGF